MRPGGEGQLGMLALARLKARLAPEWSAHTRPPSRVARPRPIPGIGATAAPARLERKPGATRHRLDPVLFRRVLFLRLCFLQGGERRLLLVRALLSLVQIAGRGRDQAAATRAVKPRDGGLLGVEFAALTPAVAGENMPLVVNRFEFERASPSPAP